MLFSLFHYLIQIIATFLGKSGIVAERMSTSLSSTGTPAHYVHGAEWTHGDLGMFYSLQSR